MSKLYVVVASLGEFSERSEWICGVFSTRDEAVSLAEEHSKKAKEDYVIYESWLKCNWKVRDKLPVPEKWKVKEALVEKECGPAPPSREADDFTVVEVEIGVWKKWETIK